MWTDDCTNDVAHAHFTFHALTVSAPHFLLQKGDSIAMDRSSATIISSDSESESEVVIGDNDLSFHQLRLKGKSEARKTHITITFPPSYLLFS